MIVYTNQLEGQDFFKLGIKARINGEHFHSDSPTENYLAGDNAVSLAILNKLSNDFTKGWFHENNRQLNQKIDDQHALLLASFPALHDKGYITFQNAKDSCCEASVVFVAAEKDSYVVQYIDSNGNKAMKVIGCQGETWITWYDTKPA